MANITHLTDPFRPQLNPVQYALAESKTINEVLASAGLIGAIGQRLKPFVVIVDGEYVLQHAWGDVLALDSIMVTVDLPPYLQGGGSGGSNPMRLVLQAALIAAAFYIPGALGLTSAWAIGSTQMGIMLAGGLLINTLLPQPKLGGSMGGASSAPQYLIGPQQNEARLGMRVPVLYGRRRVYPDQAMAPYTENSGNEQYLHQLFCITQGKIQIEQIAIEKTPIDHFYEVEYKVIGPNEAMRLFPDNVYTAPEVTGLVLDGVDKDSKEDTIGYEGKVTYTAIDDEKGRPPTSEYWEPTYEKALKYTPIKAKINYRGGYVATPLGQKTSRIGVDVMCPRGLAYMDDNGNPKSNSVDFIVQARELDDSNSPVGSWFNLTQMTKKPDDTVEIVHSQPPAWLRPKPVILPVSASIKGATIDPIMQTYSFNVPLGRYEVRVARTSKSGDATRISDEIQWSGVRSYMPNKVRYGNVTLLAVKIRATNNLNSNIARRVNVLGTRILPVFNGRSWVEQPTRSIAWAAADVFMNKTYGRKLPEKRLNMTELMRLDAIWYARSDFCDAIFTDDTTTWEAATRILECGRTKPIYYAGVVDFSRNEKKTMPAAMFTPNNMLKDSFSVEFATVKSDQADYVIVQYTDPVSGQTKEVECAFPDSKKLKPATIQMLAITSRQQAWREGIHRAAMHRVQRQFPSWKTEMEGLIPRYGDMVLYSHDVQNSGATGLIESFDGTVIQVNESLPWTGSDSITLRGKDGSAQGPFKITRIDDFSGRIVGDPYISNGHSEEPTHYIFGAAERVGMKVVMLGAVPDADGRVGMTFVNYSDLPHTAENDLKMPIEVVPTDPVSEVLAITWIKVWRSIEQNVFEVTANQARGAVRYDFEVADNIGAPWRKLYSGEAPIYTGALPYGDQIRIRARAVGTYEGEWFVLTTAVAKEDDPINRVKPGLDVVKSGTNPVYADVTITGVEIPNVVNYVIEQDGVIIWISPLIEGKKATIRRQFTPTEQPEPPEEPIFQRVEFKAYAIDNDGKRSEEAIVTMIY